MASAAVLTASPAQRVRFNWRALVLPAIFGVALLLRCLAASAPSIHHPDEIFQYLEAAHRLVFGYGIVPWEYHAGIRNWMMPLLLVGPMRLGEALAPGGMLYLTFATATMVAISLVVPWSGWMLGRPLSRTHAGMAALVGATWAEFVIFAPHTLSENLAAALLLGGAVALNGEKGWRAIVAGGALLGLAGIARFQFAPAIGVLALFACRVDWRRWSWLALGGLVAMSLGAVMDLATGLTPFGWLVQNVRENVVGGRAAQYGTLGVLGYVAWFEHVWSWWLLALLPLIRLGARRYPALFWAALANVALHSLISHKEFRFVEVSSVLFVLLAAIGSVDACAWVQRRWPGTTRPAVLAGTALLWLAASASLAVGPTLSGFAAQGSDTLLATDDLRADAGACGIALTRDIVSWGGYSYLHRPLPVSYFDANDPLYRTGSRAAAVRAAAPGFNRIVGSTGDERWLPTTFHLQSCHGQVCTYARSGGCDPIAGSPFELQRVFDRVDEQMRADIARLRAAHPSL